LLCPICLLYKSSVFCHGNGSLNPTLQRNNLQKYRSTYMQIESNRLYNTIVNRASLFSSFFLNMANCDKGIGDSSLIAII
jgi:hypothetical protein